MNPRDDSHAERELLIDSRIMKHRQQSGLVKRRYSFADAPTGEPVVKVNEIAIGDERASFIVSSLDPAAQGI